MSQLIPANAGPYIFDHIPKTAGTTFQFAYVMAAFGPGEFLISDSPHKELSSFTSEQTAKLKIICGHRAGLLRSVFPNARWLTIVRKPVDRAISVYLHARYHADAWNLIGREVNEGNISLGQFIEEDLFFRRGGEPGSVKDQQARIVLGPDYDPSILNDRQAVSEIIRSRFCFCGCTESFEMFLFVLHITEGWPLLLFTNRLVRKERVTFSPDAQDIAAIERYNTADSIVYDCVRREFDSKVAEIWTDGIGRRYEEYIDALRTFRAKMGENQSSEFMIPTG